MTEWALALVLVPIIVAPFVLAFGFSGCQLVFQAEFTPAPTSVSAVATGLTSIRVAWDHAESGKMTFEVIRTPDGGEASLPIPTPDLFLDDAGLEEGTTYFYRVRAVEKDGGDKSSLSDEASATTPALQPAFMATLTNNQTQQGGKTVVQRIEPARLFRSGSLVRITLRASTQGDVLLERMSISHAAAVGDPYDSDTPPTPIPAGLALLANTSLALPVVAFSLDQTRPLLVAFDLGPPGHVRHLPNVPAVEARAFVQDGDEALVQDRQTGYALEDRIYLIERIDVA